MEQDIFQFFNRLLQLYIKKDTVPLSTFVLVSYLGFLLSHEDHLRKEYLVSFSLCQVALLKLAVHLR